MTYKLNTSVENCRNAGHKIADLEFLTEYHWR